MAKQKNAFRYVTKTAIYYWPPSTWHDFLNHTAPTAQGWGYAVFGKVIEGTDAVDTIRKVRTGSSGFHQDVPTEDVVIEKATVLEE